MRDRSRVLYLGSCCCTRQQTKLCRSQFVLPVRHACRDGCRLFSGEPSQHACVPHAAARIWPEPLLRGANRCTTGRLGQYSVTRGVPERLHVLHLHFWVCDGGAGLQRNARAAAVRELCTRHTCAWCAVHSCGCARALRCAAPDCARSWCPEQKCPRCQRRWAALRLSTRCLVKGLAEARYFQG